jgi:hypothetical protein
MLEAGVLAAEGWLSIVMVQDRLIGFLSAYCKTPALALPTNILQFPGRKCERKTVNAVPGVVVPFRRH